MQDVHVVFQDLLGTRIVAVDDAADFGVDIVRGFIGDVFVLGDGTAEEDFAFFFAVSKRPQFFRESPTGNHAARNRGGAFDVIGSAGRNLVFAVNQGFSDAAAVEGGDLAFQAAFGIAVAILFWQEHGNAEGAAARDDGDFVHRVVLRHDAADDAMPRFVVGSHFFFFVAHHHRAAFGTHHDFVFGVFHVLHGDFLSVAPRGKERRFVGEVGKVGTRETGRAARDVKRLDCVVERFFAHMHFEYLLAAFEVGQPDDDLAVETAGAQQCGVEDVRAVGGGDDDDAFVAFKAVHFNEELVQGLLAFVVPAAKPGATLAANRVNFVDKDDAGRVFFRFFKHVADARSTDTDEHFYKIRAGNGEERHFCLAGNGACQQRFPGAGRADHQQAARDLPAKAAEFAWVAQKLNHFHHVRFCFIGTGNVCKGNFDFVFRDEAGAAFAKGKGTTLATALQLAGGEHKEANEQQYRQ